MFEIGTARCALLVMDLQNEIVHEEGFVGGQGVADEVRQRRVLDNTARALAAARAAAIPVYHIGMAYRKGYPDINLRAPIFKGIQSAGALLEGSWGSQFDPAVEPLDTEPVIFKRGVGAFGGTDLQRILHFASIETLILLGVATNFVVEATARHAVDAGFGVIVVQDCCATFNVFMHEAALGFLRFLGPVIAVDELVAALRARVA